MTYVSHARTPEELKTEVESDLRRRLEMLKGYTNSVVKGAAERARIACAERELIAMLNYWENVEIIRPARKRTKAEAKKGISGSGPLPHISSPRN
jgi:hypothetical protein